MAKCMRGEGALCKEMSVYGFTVLTQGTATVGSGAVEVLLVEIMAIARLTLEAGVAGAACFKCDCNVITFLKSCDLTANFLNNAAAFVTEYAGQRYWKILVAADQIGVAYAHPDNPD